MEDTTDESLPESLAGLVLKYKLYEPQKSGKAKGGFIFRDQHNAGNDSVANLKGFFRMVEIIPGRKTTKHRSGLGMSTNSWKVVRMAP